MILSALGILFVVDAHAWSPLGLFTNFFPYNSFFMPMFCFISGYFFKPEKLSNLPSYLFHKFKGLILPFFIWNFAYGILVNILKYFGIIRYGEPLSLYTIFIQPFLDCSMFQFNFPAWFVPALFIVIVVYTFMLKVFSKIWNDYIMALLLIIVGTACVYLSRRGYSAQPLYLVILKTGFFIQFYQLGVLFKSSLEKYYQKIPSFLVLSGCLLINVICIYISGDQIYFNDLATMSGFLTDYYLLPLITSISGSLFWLKISEYLSPVFGNNKWVNYISNNTFTIMMHHMLFFNVYNAILGILAKYSVINIYFDYDAFASSAWYRFEPFVACRVIYVFFGMTFPILFKYIYEKYIKNFLCLNKNRGRLKN